MTRRPRSALDVALGALSRRELSAHELAARLEQAGVDEVEVGETITRLQEAGYQSDARAAAERARVLADRRLGDAAIRADLTGRGLDEEAIEPALAELPPELDRAQYLARRAGSGQALARALRTKGFSSDTVEVVLARVIANRS